MRDTGAEVRVLIGRWLRFLDAIEDLAEDEATASGAPYTRGPRHQRIATAILTARHGQRPPPLSGDAIGVSLRGPLPAGAGYQW